MFEIDYQRSQIISQVRRKFVYVLNRNIFDIVSSVTRVTKYFVYYRLFLVYIDFKQDIQATIVYAGLETNSLANDSRKDPVLVVGNNGDLKSILPYESVRINNKWKKW